MSYYATIEEDLQRAKAMLADARQQRDAIDRVLQHLPERDRSDAMAAVYGADIYAAYKLLERFVAEIEQLRAEQDGGRAVLQAVLDAVKGTLDTSSQIADHPNVKFVQMQMLQARHREDHHVAAEQPFDHNGECTYCDEPGMHRADCPWLKELLRENQRLRESETVLREEIQLLRQQLHSTSYATSPAGERQFAWYLERFDPESLTDGEREWLRQYRATHGKD